MSNAGWKDFATIKFCEFHKMSMSLSWNCFLGKVCVHEERTQLYSMREKYPYSQFLWSVFHKFALNTDRWWVSFSIQSKCGKIRTRKTPNRDAFHAVIVIYSFMCNVKTWPNINHEWVKETIYEGLPCKLIPVRVQL